MVNLIPMDKDNPIRGLFQIGNSNKRNQIKCMIILEYIQGLMVNLEVSHTWTRGMLIHLILPKHKLSFRNG